MNTTQEYENYKNGPELDAFGYPRLRKIDDPTDSVKPHTYYIMNHGQRINRKPFKMMDRPYLEGVSHEYDYKNMANYQSNFAYDTHEPTLGYGYSYKDRLGRKCGMLKMCDDNSNNYRNMVETNWRPPVCPNHRDRNIRDKNVADEGGCPKLGYQNANRLRELKKGRIQSLKDRPIKIREGFDSDSRKSTLRSRRDHMLIFMVIVIMAYIYFYES